MCEMSEKVNWSDNSFSQKNKALIVENVTVWKHFHPSNIERKTLQLKNTLQLLRVTFSTDVFK